MVLLLITAFALSADGFAAGLSFGLRGVRIGAGAKLTIALLSVLFAGAAVALGTVAGVLLPNAMEKAIGAGILLLMGAATVLRALRPEPPCGSAACKASVSPPQAPPCNGPAGRIPGGKHRKGHPLSTTVMVVRNPSCGDVDGSGTIDCKEAFLLGFSLSVDMLGAGSGLVLGGAHPLWLLPPLAGAVQIFCLAAGEAVGHRFHALRLGKQTLAFASGILLAALGLARLFC